MKGFGVYITLIHRAPLRVKLVTQSKLTGDMVKIFSCGSTLRRVLLCSRTKKRIPITQLASARKKQLSYLVFYGVLYSLMHISISIFLPQSQ